MQKYYKKVSNLNFIHVSFKKMGFGRVFGRIFGRFEGTPPTGYHQRRSLGMLHASPSMPGLQVVPGGQHRALSAQHTCCGGSALISFEMEVLRQS